MHARLPIAISLLIACNACAEDCPKTIETAVEDAHGVPTCEHIEPRNDREVVLCNDLDEGIIANVAFPPEDPPPGGWPGVVVLHGSGGLHDSGPDDEDPCRESVQAQFAGWAAALNQRGYAVIMPASFYSRGFCEWNDGTRPDDMDDHERLILRTFDAAAAVEWMCEDPRVDCSRLALLGFSNGGSVALMLMHEGLPYTKDARLHAIDNLPPIVGAAAYYPGCGLEDELVNDLTETDMGRFYWPTAPIWVPHAEKDSLLDDCEEIRDPQVDMIAEKRGVETDMFELEIYDNAKHGFDATSSDGRKSDYHASVDAQARTLERFEAWFKK